MNATETLKQKIKLLEHKKAMDKELLKEQFHVTLQSFKPGNLVKDLIGQVSSSSQVKGGLLKAAIGLTVGYFTKKLVTRKKQSLMRKLLGSAIQFGVTGLVARYAEPVKDKSVGFFKHIFHHSNSNGKQGKSFSPHDN